MISSSLEGVRTGSRYLCRRTCKGRRGEAIKEAVERGAVILSVCGGYQMLGHYYRPFEKNHLPGIGLFDAHTDAGDKRYIGNVLIDCNLPGVGTIVAFENHSGKTYLHAGCTPLGKSIIGGGEQRGGRHRGCDL